MGIYGDRINEKKLQQLKNRVARILALSNYETRSKDLLDDLGWEVLVDRRIRKLAISMYKITHNISPPCLRNIFQNVSDSYDLRNSSINLNIPKPKLETGKLSLLYRGSVLWNKIPVEAREQESTEPSKCHSNFALNFFCLEFFPDFYVDFLRKAAGPKLVTTSDFLNIVH